MINITLDGIAMQVEEKTTIKDALSSAGLMVNEMPALPLAAMIGGRVCSLNYVLKRDCAVRILRYGQEEGRRVYERSLKFVLICAVRSLFPHIALIERYSLGKGVYLTFDKDDTNDREDFLTQDDVKAVEEKCREIVKKDIPFVRTRLTKNEATEHYRRTEQKDKCELLEWRKSAYFDTYSIEGYDTFDYYYGEMLPSTGYLKVFRLEYLNGGLVMLMPDVYDPKKCAEYVHPVKLAHVFAQTDDWCALMDCRNVSDINRHVKNGEINELILVNEILHERMYAKAADEITDRDARAVLVAGPSSSGKTTSANRICSQLRAFGKKPIQISLDNYYLDRDRIKADENGETDLENINALDVARFADDFEKLIRGEETEIPVFNFRTGRREEKGMTVRADENSPLIIEGIHGLNPLMFTQAVDAGSLYRIYVSALTTLNLDNHNRIRTSDVRLMRRLVRDYRMRNASVELTLSMWDSVRRGEEKWIFPYQESADMILNTTLLYELSVMKKYVYDLLISVSPESTYYTQAMELVKFLSYFEETDTETDEKIPPTSVLREFIGGSVFF